MTSEKERVAKFIADRLPDKGTIALGAGSTVNKIIEYMDKKRGDISVVTASAATSYKLMEVGIPEVSFVYAHGKISVLIDGADQIKRVNGFEIIKGHGGALVREKILWESADNIIVAIDSSKLVEQFTTYVPVEITPFALPMVTNKIHDKLGIPIDKIQLREYKNGVPLITENNNFIIDLFIEPMQTIEKFGQDLKTITGVVDTGIFAFNEKNIEVIVGKENSVVSL